MKKLAVVLLALGMYCNICFAGGLEIIDPLIEKYGADKIIKYVSTKGTDVIDNVELVSGIVIQEGSQKSYRPVLKGKWINKNPTDVKVFCRLHFFDSDDFELFTWLGSLEIRAWS